MLHILILEARIKQLAVKKNAPPVYIELLPSSPRVLLRDYPEIANRLFNAQQLPVISPLNHTAIDAIRGRINMRGGKKTGLGGDATTSAQSMVMQGLYTHARCM